MEEIIGITFEIDDNSLRFLPTNTHKRILKQ